MGASIGGMALIENLFVFPFDFHVPPCASITSIRYSLEDRK